MKHEDCMKQDAEYKRTYDILLKEELSIEKILEVAVKSNGMVGVGVVTFNQTINEQLVKLMRGY